MAIWDVFTDGHWQASFRQESEARQYVRRSVQPEHCKVVESAVKWEQVGSNVKEISNATA